MTRTISLDNNEKRVKNIFTRVLKGHIAVANYKLKKGTVGSQIDKKARKYLKEINLDYEHGTGHGVVYFLNVHEGPHAISKSKKTNNKVLDKMIARFKELPSGKKYSRNLLKAFIMDASNKKYKNWNDLLYYCKFSANPVGRFVIDAVNERKNIEKIYEASDNLCTALQIINHIQDCKKDFKELNRVYIPESFFKKYSLDKKILRKSKSEENFERLIIEIIDNVLTSLRNT